MDNFKETNYNTVTERIFIRMKVGKKWENISLKDCLKHQDNLKRWLMEYVARHVINIGDEEITEDELIHIIKWLDSIGVPPVRLKHDAFFAKNNK